MNKFHSNVQFADYGLNFTNFLPNILNDTLIKNKKKELLNNDFLQEKLEFLQIKLDNSARKK